MSPLPHPLEALAARRGALFVFAPVCLGIGIGGYFWLPSEPGGALLAGLALGAALMALAGLRGPERWQPLAWAASLVAAGLVVAALRTRAVAAPVLPYRYYGPIEGRIVQIDRSASDRPRITLDRLTLTKLRPEQVPHRVRLTLMADPPAPDIVPGTVVKTLGFLGPPQGPAEPGGFDFQRLAWFREIGGVGYGRKPLEVLARPLPGSLALIFPRLRNRIAVAVRARIPGDPGGFVAAILTNDKSGLSQSALASLRTANLAHMLAISGLHMALVTGFVFALLRSGLALIPAVALRLNTKKIAAVVALAGAGFYLMLSGAAVSTERSFVMVAVALVAVLADRRAISMRSIAISALIVLVLRPESLTEAGFQMSYAATVALVAAFEAAGRLKGRWPRPPRWAAPVLGLAFSSTVAGLATSPFAAAYFGHASAYGLLANMLTLPVMGMVEMPGAVIAGLLAPLGLEGPALWVVGQGARWILTVAGHVSGLPGAVIPVAAPPAVVLPMLTLGMLWLILWPGRARFAGIALAVAALALWSGAGRPVLVVADTGGYAGLMTPEGRVLSRPKGGGFASHAWLTADGDPATPEEAAARPGFSGPNSARRFALAGVPAIVLSGRRAADAATGACAAARVVFVEGEGPKTPPQGCLVIGRKTLRRTGALALWRRGARLEFVTTTSVQGDRPWVRGVRRWPLRPPRLPPIRLDLHEDAPVVGRLETPGARPPGA
ncbi:MAG: ComEC/Rec2 family competence protein [Paracoccaceae bacterium]|nr:ComEC/Rec2 family competence protein [Paracoccaceae bacterium]